MAKRLLLVAGNIGAGKTSLTERLGARLGWRTAFESVADNPYLPDFYRDMRSWAFQLQVFFLGHRAQQYLEMARSPNSVIFDRSIFEDAHIFARALHHLGDLDERDYISYRRVFELIVSNLPPPNLLIYLKAPASVLLERIRMRGRSIEGGITEEYLTLLIHSTQIGLPVSIFVQFSLSTLENWGRKAHWILSTIPATWILWLTGFRIC